MLCNNTTLLLITTASTTRMNLKEGRGRFKIYVKGHREVTVLLSDPAFKINNRNPIQVISVMSIGLTAMRCLADHSQWEVRHLG